MGLNLLPQKAFYWCAGWYVYYVPVLQIQFNLSVVVIQATSSQSLLVNVRIFSADSLFFSPGSYVEIEKAVNFT